VLDNLSIALEHNDNPKKRELFKTTAGMMFLPCLLVDKSEYFCQVYEIIICTAFVSAQLFDE
jgi:hypothetical protein